MRPLNVFMLLASLSALGQETADFSPSELEDALDVFEITTETDTRWRLENDLGVSREYGEMLKSDLTSAWLRKNMPKGGRVYFSTEDLLRKRSALTWRGDCVAISGRVKLICTDEKRRFVLIPYSSVVAIGVVDGGRVTPREDGERVRKALQENGDQIRQIAAAHRRNNEGFAGWQNIYFDGAEVMAHKPAISQAKVTEARTISGANFIVAGENPVRWLISGNALAMEGGRDTEPSGGTQKIASIDVAGRKGAVVSILTLKITAALFHQNVDQESLRTISSGGTPVSIAFPGLNGSIEPFGSADCYDEIEAPTGRYFRFVRDGKVWMINIDRALFTGEEESEWLKSRTEDAIAPR